MMGHAPPRGDTADWDGYLRQLDNWPVVAQMTERIVYDPDCTTHPMFARTLLAPEVSGKSDQPSIGYSFRAAEPCPVEIVVQTAEIGDSITVITDGVLQDKSCAPVVFEGSALPPFLAVPRSREYYERLQQIAESWDAASFWLSDPPRGGLQPIIDY